MKEQKRARYDILFEVPRGDKDLLSLLESR